MGLDLRRSLEQHKGASALDDFGDAEGLEHALAQASLELGRPATRRELQLLVGADKRLGDRAINAPQRKLVLTNAGRSDGESGWGSTLHDLFARRWRAKLRRLPERERALASLAEAVLVGTQDVSAADLAAALRIRRPEASDTLERLEARGRATRREEEGMPYGRLLAQRRLGLPQAEQGAGDHEPLDLARPLRDLRDLRVAVRSGRVRRSSIRGGEAGFHAYAGTS